MPAPGTPPLLRVHVDVTDTVRAQWRAGIQRVVLQLLSQLRALGPELDIEVCPVVWFDAAQRHRALTPAELASLEPARPDGDADSGDRSGDGSGDGAPGRRALDRLMTLAHAPELRPLRRLLRPLRRAVRALVRVTGGEPLLAAARRWLRRRTVDRHLVPLMVDLEPGSVLLEMDSVWNVVEVDRDALYRHLRARGVHVAVLVYDLLPIEHPEWFEPSLVEVFTRALAAQMDHADLVLAISEHSAAAVVEWRGTPEPEPVVIPLGAEVGPPAPVGIVGAGVPRAAPQALPRGGTDSTPDAAPDAAPDDLGDAPYVLVVGTVEPRKNHAVLLDACERLWQAGEPAQLVVVGRPGWNNEELLTRLRHHPELGRRLRWYDRADDRLLVRLYRHATVVAVPSVTEGFGLPVIEALAHGVPVLASNGGALPEAGGDWVDHVDPFDVDAWTRELGSLLGDPARRAARRAELVDYRPPTWDACARSVAAALLGAFGDGSRRGFPRTEENS